MPESRIRVPHARELLDMGCRCCSSRAVRMVIDLGAQPQANRLVRPDTPIGSEPVYPLRLGYCEACSLMQIDHTVPRDDMFRDYVYVSGTTETLRRHFASTVERLRAAYGVERSDLVVDIGSNDGTFLGQWSWLQKRLGVEPAVDIAEAARRDGVDTICAYFDADIAAYIRTINGPAKLITSAGSFFHMEDLHGACEGVKRLLAPDGVFVCQAISGAEVIHETAFDQVLHEHLCYYTAKSFSALMQMHGLEVFAAKRFWVHGGTNEYHVGHPGAHAAERVQFSAGDGSYLYAVDGYVECVEGQDYEVFADRVMLMRKDLLALLADYRRQGKSVWAYGAPGKGSTLLNSFGIGPDLVQCAIEKNPRKFGLSIPGCRIPIIPEGGAHPDAYLVLAWNFLDEFMEKERTYLDGGGEFIVPVPDVRVIGGKE
jgi:SAM-dependent methyltransferase